MGNMQCSADDADFFIFNFRSSYCFFMMYSFICSLSLAYTTQVSLQLRIGIFLHSY